MQQRNFMEYYRMEDREYEIEEVFSRLNEIIKSTFEDPLISKYFNPLLHHSRMAGMMDFEEIEEAHMNFLGKLPPKTVNSVHFLYDKLHMLNGKNFLKEFSKNLPYYKKWNIHSVVVHPAKGPENYDGVIVKAFSDKKFIEELKSSNLTIAIENMSSADDYYGNLTHLISLREKICDAYDEMREEELYDKIRFTFDTGHLLKNIFEEGKSPDNMHGEIANFAQNIKVFHICTNTGRRDDHIGLKKAPRSFPSDKSYINKVDPTQEIVIQNTIHLLKWLEICYKHRNPAIDLEFMLEQNDFFDPERLQEIGKWIIHEVMGE